MNPWLTNPCTSTGSGGSSAPADDAPKRHSDAAAHAEPARRKTRRAHLSNASSPTASSLSPGCPWVKILVVVSRPAAPCRNAHFRFARAALPTAHDAVARSTAFSTTIGILRYSTAFELVPER